MILNDGSRLKACGILIYVYIYIYIYIKEAPFFRSSQCLLEDKRCERKRRARRKSGPFTWEGSPVTSKNEEDAWPAKYASLQGVSILKSGGNL